MRQIALFTLVALSLSGMAATAIAAPAGSNMVKTAGDHFINPRPTN